MLWIFYQKLKENRLDEACHGFESLYEYGRYIFIIQDIVIFDNISGSWKYLIMKDDLKDDHQIYYFEKKKHRVLLYRQFNIVLFGSWR